MLKCQLQTSKVQSRHVEGTCRGIWVITPKFPAKTSSRQSRTEGNRWEQIWRGRWKSCTQLNRPSDQLIANHGEFQALCDDHDELQEAGTWLLESQELVKELMCRTVEYGEVKTRTSGMDSNAHIKPKTPKVRRKRTDHSTMQRLRQRPSSSNEWY